MKERIMTGWTWARLLYLLAGLFLMIHSIVEERWIGVALGGYFAAMGLFAFGCAGGMCYPGISSEQSAQNSDQEAEDVKFDEVKSKQDGKDI